MARWEEKRCVVCKNIVREKGCDEEFIDICPSCYYWILGERMEFAQKENHRKA